MKINGFDPSSLPTEEVLVLPRGNNFLTFRAKGLPNLDEFTKLCPEPIVPGKLTPEGWKSDLTDTNYVSDMQEFSRRRLAYMVVKSLEPSNIEWDSVDLGVPGTWANWETDLKAANLTQVECNLVLGLVLGANQLDEAKLKKARDVFLHGPQPASAK